MMGDMDPVPQWRDRLCAWLKASLTAQDLAQLIPLDDPLRDWWRPTASDLGIGLLLDLLCGGREHLTLLAAIQTARTKASAPAMPEDLDAWLTVHLGALSRESRRTPQRYELDLFLSYSHRDMERAVLIADVLQEDGVRIFRDTRHIGPGDDIVACLREAITSAPQAALLVSRHYIASEWSYRELQILTGRYLANRLGLVPILLDDVPLPAEIAGLHTLDLRGLRPDSDVRWVRSCLRGLIESCRRRRDG